MPTFRLCLLHLLTISTKLTPSIISTKPSMLTISTILTKPTMPFKRTKSAQSNKLTESIMPKCLLCLLCLLCLQNLDAMLIKQLLNSSLLVGLTSHWTRKRVLMNNVWIRLLPTDYRKKHKLLLFTQQSAQETQYYVIEVNWLLWASFKKNNQGFLGISYPTFVKELLN